MRGLLYAVSLALFAFCSSYKRNDDNTISETWTLTDIISITETITSVLTRTDEVSETITSESSVTDVLTITDDISITESITTETSSTDVLTLTDDITITESITITSATSIDVSDILTLTDTITSYDTLTYPSSTTETDVLTLTDIITETVTASESPSESWITDIVTDTDYITETVSSSTWITEPLITSIITITDEITFSTTVDDAPEPTSLPVVVSNKEKPRRAVLSMISGDIEGVRNIINDPEFYPIAEDVEWIASVCIQLCTRNGHPPLLKLDSEIFELQDSSKYKAIGALILENNLFLRMLSPTKALLLACAVGDVPTISDFSDFAVEDHSGNSDYPIPTDCLTIAALANNVEAVQYLLDNPKLDPHPIGDYGNPISILKKSSNDYRPLISQIRSHKRVSTKRMIDAFFKVAYFPTAILVSFYKTLKEAFELEELEAIAVSKKLNGDDEYSYDQFEKFRYAMLAPHEDILKNLLEDEKFDLSFFPLPKIIEKQLIEACFYPYLRNVQLQDYNPNACKKVVELMINDAHVVNNLPHSVKALMASTAGNMELVKLYTKAFEKIPRECFIAAIKAGNEKTVEYFLNDCKLSDSVYDDVILEYENALTIAEGTTSPDQKRIYGLVRRDPRIKRSILLKNVVQAVLYSLPVVLLVIIREFFFEATA